MIFLIRREPPHRKLPHNQAYFLEEGIQGFQTLDIQLSVKIDAFRIIGLAGHSDSGGEFGVQFPGALAVLVGEFATELDDTEIKGEGTFVQNCHGARPFLEIRGRWLLIKEVERGIACSIYMLALLN
jgi:hypothetical protein